MSVAVEPVVTIGPYTQGEIPPPLVVTFRTTNADGSPGPTIDLTGCTAQWETRRHRSGDSYPFDVYDPNSVNKAAVVNSDQTPPPSEGGTGHRGEVTYTWVAGDLDIAGDWVGVMWATAGSGTPRYASIRYAYHVQLDIANPVGSVVPDPNAGVVTVPKLAVTTGPLNVPDASIAESKVINLVNDLAAKVPLVHTQLTVPETGAGSLVSGIDATAQEDFLTTLTASRVMGLPVNGVAGRRLHGIITQGGAGGFGLTFVAGIVVKNFALNMAAGDKTEFTLTCLSPTSWILASNPASLKSGFTIINAIVDNGAKGDGVTDDTAAIQAAIAALPAAGGIVHLPAGVYKITSQLALGTNKILQGVGMGNLTQNGATRILKTGNFDGIAVGAVSMVRDLEVDGFAGNGGDGIYMTGGRNHLMNVSVKNQGGVGIRLGGKTAGINSNGWGLTHIVVGFNTSHGIYIHDISTGVGTPNVNSGNASGFISTNNGGDGIRAEHCLHNTWFGAQITSNAGAGIRLFNGAQGVAQGQDFYMPYCEANGANDVTIDNGCTQNSIFGCRPQLQDQYVDNNTDGSNWILGRQINSNLWKLSPFQVDAPAAWAGNIIEFLSQDAIKLMITQTGSIQLPNAATFDLSINAGSSASAINFGNNAANLLRLDFWGHVISKYIGAPVTSALGANITSVTFTGNDTRGKIVIVVAAGGLAANTKICHVAWANDWVTPVPIPQLTDQTPSPGLAHITPYSASEVTNGFDLFANQALVVGTYTLRYTAIG